jgi:hypothetical protein
MSATNSNCVEVTFNTSGGTLDWSLYKGGDFSIAAETTNANNNDTYWTGCFDEPFDCAELRVRYVPSENDISTQPPPYTANLHVVWNDIIWVEGWTPVSDAYGNNNGDVSVVWIGNECHKYSYNLCMTNPNAWTWNGAKDDTSNMWLLDVQLTTKALLNNDNNIYPEDEFPIYWRVYSNFRGNLLNDPFYFKYRSNNATYRSLSCIEYKDGCTEFGIAQISAVASHPIIRVNGIEKTDRYTNCSDERCDGDVVTPLEGCDFWSQLSGGARAGIVLAAVAGAAILYSVAAPLIIRRKRNERQEEEARA